MKNIFLFLLLAYSSFAQVGLYQVEDGNLHEKIELTAANIQFEICELLPGTTYHISINDQRNTNQCDYQLFHENGQIIDEEFKAKTNCQTFLSERKNCKYDQLGLGLIEIYINSKSIPNTRLDKLKSLPNYDVNYLVEEVLLSASCFDVFNVNYQGEIGTFENGNGNINLNAGIIIATSSIYELNGKNTGSNTGGIIFGPDKTDADFEAILGRAMHDVSYIEFDFTPTAPILEFDYVFASEEYCEFVGSPYNDAFAFLISGPGITPDNSNTNYKNIALLPNSSTQVSINSVNYGTNGSYYVSNEIAGVTDTHTACNNIPPNTNGCCNEEVTLDGFTVPLTASIDAIPCQTYHLKMIIGDGDDRVYGSAVFLKESSFREIGAVSYDFVFNQTGTNIIYEGCGNQTGRLILTRTTSDGLNLPLTVVATLGGTAEKNLDYILDFDTQITIPANQLSIEKNITVLADNIIEGPEQVTFTLDGPCTCASDIFAFEILEVPEIKIFVADTIFICNKEPIELSPIITGGFPAVVSNSVYQTKWKGPNAFSSIEKNITVQSPMEGKIDKYEFKAEDECGNTAELVIYIAYKSGADALNIQAAQTVMADCNMPNQGTAMANSSGGTPPYTYLWSTNETTIEIKDLDVGIYTVTVTDADGCQNSTSVEITGGASAPIAMISLSSILDCNYTSVQLSSAGSSTGNNIELNWIGSSISDLNSPNPMVSDSGKVFLVVKDTDTGCSTTTSIFVDQNTNPPIFSIGSPGKLDCMVDTVSIYTYPTYPINYAVSWSNGEITDTIFVDEEGSYDVIYTDLDNGCTFEASALIVSNTNYPNIDAGMDDTLSCMEEFVTIIGSGDLGPAYIINWASLDGTINITTPTFQVQIGHPDTYILTVENKENHCISTDTVEIFSKSESPSDIKVQLDLPQCDVETGTLFIDSIINGSPPFQYSLDGNPWTTTLVFDNLIVGDHELMVLDAASCDFTLYFNIPTSETFFLSDTEQLVIDKQNSQLAVITNIPEDEIASIHWSPAQNMSCTDCLNPIFEGTENSTYLIEITDIFGCVKTATIQVKFITKIRPEIIMPNVISINDDDINDFFYIYTPDDNNVKQITLLQIYDRWGSLVFEKKNTPILSKKNSYEDKIYGWDGKFRGEKVNQGVYAYWFEVEFYDGTFQVYEGDLTVVN